MSTRRLANPLDDDDAPWLRKRLLAFGETVAREAWLPSRITARGPSGVGWRVARIGWLAGRGIFRDQCLLRASALTYITVLSLVPLLALAFAIAKGFGFYTALEHDVISPFLNRTFGPLPPVGAPVAEPESGLAMRVAIEQVLAFVDGTKFSALGIIGLLALLWTGLKLLGAIEQAFNDIWDVARPRTLMRKLADYLAMVVVTPIFVFAATGITTAQGGALARFLRESLGLGLVVDAGLQIAPLLALWASFTFLYYAMPNARTKITSAALGGFVAAVLWQGALILHIRFQVGVAGYNAIYASFAAIPIFLVWVNLSWVIVLLGAELCFAHQSEPSYAEAPSARPADPSLGVSSGLRATLCIATTFAAGGGPRTTTAIAEELGLPEPAVGGALGLLARAGILVVIEQGDDECYMLARDPGSIRVKEVLDVLRRAGAGVDLPPRTKSDVVADQVLAGLEAEYVGSAHNRTLRELAEMSIRTPDPRAEPIAIDSARAENPGVNTSNVNRTRAS